LGVARLQIESRHYLEALKTLEDVGDEGNGKGIILQEPIQLARINAHPDTSHRASVVTLGDGQEREIPRRIRGSRDQDTLFAPLLNLLIHCVEICTRHWVLTDVDRVGVPRVDANFCPRERASLARREMLVGVERLRNCFRQHFTVSRRERSAHLLPILGQVQRRVIRRRCSRRRRSRYRNPMHRNTKRRKDIQTEKYRYIRGQVHHLESDRQGGARTA